MFDIEKPLSSSDRAPVGRASRRVRTIRQNGRASLLVAILVTALCGFPSCTWLDHPTNASLQRELMEHSAGEGLALANFVNSNSSLHVRFFDGREEVIELPCCPPTASRTISRNRLVMVNTPALSIPTIVKSHDAITLAPNTDFIPKVGHIVTMNPRGKAVAISELELGRYIATMSPDEKQFAFVGRPNEDPDTAYGIYVAGLHDKEPRKLVALTLPHPREPLNVMTRVTVDWSPDGHSLLFSDQQTVSIVSLESGLLRKVADGGGAQWSPSSDWISYVTLKFQAALLNVTTGETKLIDKDKEILRPLEWSPDGKYLLIYEGNGSHVPYGCLWIYRVLDGAYVPIPHYGTGGPSPHWIRLGGR